MSISYLQHLFGACLLILGNNDGNLIGVGGRNFQTVPTSGQFGVERVSGLPPSIFMGRWRHHTTVCFNGIENRGNIPVAIVLESRIGGCLQVHRMGEEDEVEKL